MSDQVSFLSGLVVAVGATVGFDSLMSFNMGSDVAYLVTHLAALIAVEHLVVSFASLASVNDLGVHRELQGLYYAAWTLSLILMTD